MIIDKTRFLHIVLRCISQFEIRIRIQILFSFISG